MTAQSALLGAKDSVTPLLVTLGAGFLNLVLDFVLVTYGKMGISGAALATVTAEIVGACCFLSLSMCVCVCVCVCVAVEVCVCVAVEVCVCVHTQCSFPPGAAVSTNPDVFTRNKNTQARPSSSASCGGHRAPRGTTLSSPRSRSRI